MKCLRIIIVILFFNSLSIFAQEIPLFNSTYLILEWYRNQEPDLMKYKIYKRITSELGFQYIGETTDTFYVDNTEQCLTGPPEANEHIVSYAVTAVDNTNKESDPSDAVSTRVKGLPLEKALSQKAIVVDTTLKSFFPLQIGNYWEYQDMWGTKIFVKIISDTVINNKTYYLFNNSYEGKRAFRIDDSMNVWIYYDGPNNCNNEALIFKLSLPDSSIWIECKYPISWVNSELNFPCLLKTELINYPYLNNITKLSKWFSGVTIDTVRKDTTYNSFYYNQYLLAKDIGITKIIYSESINGPLFYLTGAIINGIIYGSITNIETGFIQKNYNFSLSQSYPNPFNPSTKIKYSIKEPGLVTLKIYDLLGREIATLVNEPKQAGEYEVEFNADRYRLSSGVYLYQLTSGSFTSIKKFVLIK